MKGFNAATIVLFGVFLLAPMASLAIWGYSRMAEGEPQIDRIEAYKLLSSVDYRKDIARRVITNTPAGMLAVQTNSSWQYLAGHVNHSKVISGADGWLFYRAQFPTRPCPSLDNMRKLLRSLQAARIVAEGAGAEFWPSVSPDKSVAHPEKLGARGGNLVGCKLQEARTWRSLARSMGVPLIDHLDAFANADPGTQLYYATDTHWNKTGSTLALQQLVGRLLPSAYFPALAIKQNSEVEHETDLTKLLRLAHTERGPSSDNNWIEKLGPVTKQRTVIIHDSFYGSVHGQLKQLFPNSVMVHVERHNVVKAIPENRPQLVILNSVERHLFSRLGKSWKTSFGRGLLELNRERSKRCSFNRVSKSAIATRRITIGKEEWVAQRDPQLLFRLPNTQQNHLCVRVRFRAKPSVTQLFIPDLSDPKERYVGGLSVDFHPNDADAGNREIVLVLPTRFSGKTVRIDPLPGAGRLTHLSIEVGVLDATQE